MRAHWPTKTTGRLIRGLRTRTSREMWSFAGALAALAAVAFLGCQSGYVSPGAGGSDDFLSTGTTTSFFRAYQVDPRAEDSAGPQFLATGDFNNDGLLDVASGWNESQPIQIHLQQRTATGDIQFATIPVGGTSPIARISGLEVADLDLDGFADIIVLVKDTGEIARCDLSRPDCDVSCDPASQDCGGITQAGGYMEEALAGAIVLFFNPKLADDDDLLFTQPWVNVTLSQSLLAGTNVDGPPEVGGYSSLDVGEIDGVNGPDIVVALNSAEGKATDTNPPQNTVNFFPNPGGSTARNGEGWSRIMIYGDSPEVRGCRISDVDEDGDNDVIVTFPTAKSANLRWLPNPLSLATGTTVYGLWPNFAPVGQLATEADVVEVADVDGDGATDLLVRSSKGLIIQWFKKPGSPSQTLLRNPWEVYTLAEFVDREPGAIALGDLTGDGRPETAIAAGGAVAWFDRRGNDNPFDQWAEHIIINDSPEADAAAAAAAANATTNGTAGTTTDPNATAGATGGTLVNTLLIVDVDGDGYNDILATLDRTELSGLSDDAIVFFRNTRGGD